MPEAAPLPTRIPLLDSCARLPTARRFRPRGFAPPRRFRLAAGPGFVAPQYRTGFAAFRTRGTQYPKAWPRTRRPRQRIHTLRSFPLAGSRAASLRPLPPRRSPFCAPHADLTANAALAETGPTDASRIRRSAPACQRTAATPSLEPLDPGPPTVWTRRCHQRASSSVARCMPSAMTHRRVCSTMAQKPPLDCPRLRASRAAPFTRRERLEHGSTRDPWSTRERRPRSARCHLGLPIRRRDRTRGLQWTLTRRKRREELGLPAGPPTCAIDFSTPGMC
jgi:hypothetical protein